MTSLIGRCSRCGAPLRLAVTLIRVERVGVDLLGDPIEVHVYATVDGELRTTAGEGGCSCRCGGSVRLRKLRGVKTGARCNVKCRNATSDVCECSCAGANHGSAHQ